MTEYCTCDHDRVRLDGKATCVGCGKPKKEALQQLRRLKPPNREARRNAQRAAKRRPR